MTTALSHIPPPPCRLYVGTSGYSYTEWVAAGFYPPGASPGRMLALYARHFSMTEINATAYQLPRAETLERRRRQVPPTFLFAVRLTRTLTHEIDAQRWPGLAQDYRDGLAPLIQTRQLAVVLIQLPPTFDRTAVHRRHLAALLDMLRGLPLAVEFRHRSWANDRVLNELERRQVALVTVDRPARAGHFSGPGRRHQSGPLLHPLLRPQWKRLAFGQDFAAVRLLLHRRRAVRVGRRSDWAIGPPRP